jgi:hypothetical protein
MSKCLLLEAFIPDEVYEKNFGDILWMAEKLHARDKRAKDGQAARNLILKIIEQRKREEYAETEKKRGGILGFFGLNR